MIYSKEIIAYSFPALNIDRNILFFYSPRINFFAKSKYLGRFMKPLNLTNMLIYSGIAEMQYALIAFKRKVAELIFSLPIFFIFRKHPTPFDRFPCFVLVVKFHNEIIVLSIMYKIKISIYQKKMATTEYAIA